MKKFAIAILTIFLAFQLAYSQTEHIKIKAYPTKSKVTSGEEFYIKAHFETDEYWYTYSFVEKLSDEGIGPTPSEVTLLPGDAFEKPGHFFASKPKVKYDKGFEMDIETYEKAELIIPVKAARDIDFSSGEYKVNFYIQLCDTVRCLPGTDYPAIISAEEVKVSDSDIEKLIRLNLTYSDDGYPVSSYAEAFNPENTEDDKSKNEIQKTESTAEIDEAKEKGIWTFIGLAMLLGGGSLLTPCVFPMVPITVSFFTKRSEKGQGKALRDSIIYSLGIMSTFTAIGVIAAVIGGATGIGDLATNGWVNLFIATVFLVFAFNLFGAYEIQVPTGIMNRLNAKATGSGIGSVLIMGFIFSLTSFTCTVPFVGTALIGLAGGEWFYPIVGMLAFSAVFASPFFILALLPSMMTKLPKSGGWLNNVKVVMGFIEIAAAIKFLSNADLFWQFEIISKELFLAIWILCTIMITVYILGGFKLPHDSPLNGVGSVRIVFSMAFGVLSFWLLLGAFGKPLGELDAFLPPAGYAGSGQWAATSGVNPGGGTGNTEEKWYKDYDEAVAAAKESGKNIFIDFTGWQCTNCRWMESNMFPLAESQDMMKDYVKVKLYTDSRKPEDRANKQLQQERFGSIELPLYVLMTPDEKLIATKAFTRDKQEYLDFLRKGQ